MYMDVSIDVPFHMQLSYCNLLRFGIKLNAPVSTEKSKESRLKGFNVEFFQSRENRLTGTTQCEQDVYIFYLIHFIGTMDLNWP